MQNCPSDQLPGQEGEEAQGTMTPIPENEPSLQHLPQEPETVQGQVQVQAQAQPQVDLKTTALLPPHDIEEYRPHAETALKCLTVTGYLKMSEG